MIFLELVLVEMTFILQVANKKLISVNIRLNEPF